MIDQGLIGLISFSTAPVRIAFFLGLTTAAVSALYSLTIFLLALFGVDVGPHGTATIVTALFFFGGTQLFFLGLIGEYIIAIFNQVRDRPLVIERERVNF